MLKVEEAVKDVFNRLNPRDDVTMQTFSELTLEVRKRVEGATESERKANRWLQYLLPPREEEAYVLKESGMITEPSSLDAFSSSASGTSPLRRLLDETSDLIDSPPFSQVLTMLLDAGFSTLVDEKLAQQAYKQPGTVSDNTLNAPRILEIVDIKPVKLPIILAVLTKQAHKIGNGVPNEYLQAMEQVRDLEAFAAVVYSSNWESEISPLQDQNIPGVSETSGVTQVDEVPGEESIIDVGADSRFENAWGKAVNSAEKDVI